MIGTPAQQKYVMIDHVIGGAVVNAAINAFLAWLAFRELDLVPMQGQPGVIGDAIATAFALPIAVCLCVTPLVRRAVRSGKVAPLAASPKDVPLLRWLPSQLLLRALVLVIPCVLLLAIPLVALFSLTGLDGLSVGMFIGYKAVYAGVMAAWVSPLVALYAMATTPAARELAPVGS